jgi:hypothetical protein
LIEQFTPKIGADGKQGFDTRVTLDWAVVANKDTLYMTLDDKDPEWRRATLNDAASACKTAIEEIMYFNAPGRFIVEITPDTYEREEQKARKAGRITRMAHRRKYTILTPQEIRVLMKLPPSDPTGRTQAPHERRRHKRYLRSEMFTKKRFTWVDVDVAWVGPDEAQIGKNRYKVRLDL